MIDASPPASAGTATLARLGRTIRWLVLLYISVLSLAVSSFEGAGPRHVALALSSDHVGVAVIGARC